MGKGGSVGADDERVQKICDAIRVIPDFPKVRGCDPSMAEGLGRPGAPDGPSPHAAPACCRPVPSMCPLLPAAALCQACAPFCLLPLQPGIQFQDVTTILLDPTAFKHTIDMLVERYQGQKVDVVAGAQPPRVGWQGMRGPLAGQCSDSQNGGATPAASAFIFCCLALPRPVTLCCLAWHRHKLPTGFEARGLIFGAPLAVALGCAFVPLRKPGKLPGAWVERVRSLVAHWLLPQWRKLTG